MPNFSIDETASADERDAAAMGVLHGDSRMLQAQGGGDLGDTLALILFLILVFIGVCAFLGWYSRRRG